MVRINRVYTGGGDEGETSLVDGSRRSKADLRFEVVGTCDELNAVFGLVAMEANRLPPHEDGGSRATVERVQTIHFSEQNRAYFGARIAYPDHWTFLQKLG